MCSIWLSKGLLVCGLCDGKVQKQKISSNKSSTLFSSESLVVALSSNPNGNGFLSGHLNGSIVKYTIDESHGDKIIVQNIITHFTAPYVLVWANECIFVTGCNKRVSIYDERGKLTKTLDYNSEGDQTFTAGCSSPSGQVSLYVIFFGLEILLKIILDK